MTVQRKHVCRTCGDRFRHWSHLFDHQQGTGHHFVATKKTARALRDRASPEKLKGLKIARTARGLLSLIRRFGKSGTARRTA